MGVEDTANSARDVSQGMFFPNNFHYAVWAAAGRKQPFYELHNIIIVITVLKLSYLERVFERQQAQVAFSCSEAFFMWSQVCVSCPSKPKLGRLPEYVMNNGELSVLFHLSSESMRYSHLRAGRSATLFGHAINTEETAQFSCITPFELSGGCKYSFLLC